MSTEEQNENADSAWREFAAPQVDAAGAEASQGGLPAEATFAPAAPPAFPPVSGPEFYASPFLGPTTPPPTPPLPDQAASPVTPIPAAPTPKRPRHLLVALLLITLLILGSGGLITYLTVIHPAQLHAQATATAQQATASTYKTAIAQDNLTATAQTRLNATATAQAQATATAWQNFYTSATRGRPLVSDPLNQQDGNDWDIFDDSDGRCFFKGGAYHAAEPKNGYFVPCTAENLLGANFTLQVQMKILKGDNGGLVFRYNPQNDYFYYLDVAQNGSCQLLKYLGPDGNKAKTLLDGFATRFQSEYNQPNLLTVIVRKNHFYLFVNQEYIGTASDSSLLFGLLGFTAENVGDSTEVAYSDLKIWAA